MTWSALENLRSALNRGRGSHRTAIARRYCLFLDVDGTLLEFADTPAAVSVPPSLRARLEALQRLTGGAVALISGRTLRSLDQLFAPLRLPAAGNHGLERRDSAGLLHRDITYDARLASARAELRSFVCQHPGLLMEDKHTTLALHFRRAPEYAPLVHQRARQTVAALGEPFELMQGHMVCEIRPRHPDKASAIEAFMRESPFAGRKPIFVGDDVGDVAGFDAVQRRGGMAIAVGNRVAADRQLDNPQAVRRWLNNLVATGDPLV